ncbi:MAG: LamG domain-containing protein, partial [Okeania sp. SIO2C9]|uniref:LamG domain-containing protein n=1 Tax=Okeania sp. SIO2C9 TaxID=2607791 RepID=UPI0013C16564
KGKVNGEPTVVADSKLGNCLNFDGVDDYIQMPEMNIDYSQGFTVEAWVYYQNFNNQSRVIDFANAPGKNNIIFGNRTTTNDGLLVVFVGSTRKAIEVKGILEKNQWLHLTATIDESGNAKVYKDGQEVGGGLVALPNSVNRTKNYIGKSNWSADGFFHGKMSHLRMYNRALSPEEINECMKVDGTPPPMDINRGLQLHLPLNEIVENAAKEKEVLDVSAGKLNGKVNGATVVADDRFGKCINFDGVDDYIELPTATIPETGEITISFWANGGKSLPNRNSIILAQDKSNHRVVNIHLPWSDSKIYFDCGNTTTSDNSYDRIEKLSQATDFKDKWTSWVFTKNVATGEMKIYLNGVLWQSGVGKENPLSSITQVKFGCGYGFYNGKVAHLRIYDRVLSPEEINECMKVDGTPPPMDINRGLQLHLPLNEIVENAAKEKEVLDVSAGKLNGKVNGATVVADDRFGKCINFDGVDDYIELPTATIPETGEITISFWANGGKSLPNRNSIILAQDKSNHRVVNIHLPWSDSKIYFDCGNTTTSDNSYDRIEKLSQATDFKDKWTSWVFTKNVATGEMKIYLNGVLWQSGVGKENPLSSITQVKFGCGYGFYNGKVAHLRIYDRVLSPEEINE